MGEAFFNMPASTHIANLKCGCSLNYTDFKVWIQDLQIDSGIKSGLVAAVQQIGWLSYNNWIILLNSVTYVSSSSSALFYLRQFNSCGFLCLEDLINDLLYDGESAPVGEFSSEFSSEFN